LISYRSRQSKVVGFVGCVGFQAKKEALFMCRLGSNFESAQPRKFTAVIGLFDEHSPHM
jgi:hypothetical protein